MSITIPSGVTEIGAGAFSECLRLVEIYNLSGLTIEIENTIPNGMLGYYALDIYTDANEKSKLSTDEKGFVFHTAGETKTIVGYVGNEAAITIPNDVSAINDYAFHSCDSLTHITIPESVRLIGVHAFDNCPALTSATFENTAGWSCGYSKTTSHKINISASDLSNAETAADFLKRRYGAHYWSRAQDPQ